VSEDILDFSWGDTRGLRKAILSIYKNLNTLQMMPLQNYGYPPYEGDHGLVNQLKALTKRLTNLDYSYICLTSGCTHAVNASIFALSSDRTNYVVTRNVYYPRYPDMVSMAGLIHVTGKNSWYSDADLIIIDSPSNPEGLIGINSELKSDNIIWDAAYHTPTYGVLPGTNNVESKVFCGSLSKLTGINGIRLGWTATNDQDLHDSVVKYVKSSVCGVSYPSQYVAKEILSSLENLETYFKESAKLVSYNKEEVLKLKDVFGSDHISNYGMFAFFKVDDTMLKLFDKAKVKFTSGKDCGADYPSVRINLANTNEQTKEMVQRIQKTDRSK